MVVLNLRLAMVKDGGLLMYGGWEKKLQSSMILPQNQP